MKPKLYDVWTEGEYVAGGLSWRDARAEAQETATARGADALITPADDSARVVARVAPIRNECPNLDACNDIAWLWDWGIAGAARPVRFARDVFPDRPRGYVRAARDLANYAINKATAMRCRGRGDIPAAQGYESICDRIYSKLPAFARSW